LEDAKKYSAMKSVVIENLQTELANYQTMDDELSGLRSELKVKHQQIKELEKKLAESV
jgi:uncharacterized protein involved in exopolysaccharide biosynthesis